MVSSESVFLFRRSALHFVGIFGTRYGTTALVLSVTKHFFLSLVLPASANPSFFRCGLRLALTDAFTTDLATEHAATFYIIDLHIIHDGVHLSLGVVPGLDNGDLIAVLAGAQFSCPV